MRADGSLLAALSAALQAEGIDLPGLALAWARLLPSVVLLPALGLRALPPALRAALGLALALLIAPALAPLPPAPARAWPVQLLSELALGTPPALLAAAPLLAASMAGGLHDDLHGATMTLASPLGERCGPSALLLGLLAACLFWLGHGPALLLRTLLAPLPPGAAPLQLAIAQLTQAITLALALGAPLLAAAFLLQLASALLARAAAPPSLLAPLRALAALWLLALLLGSLSELLL